MQRRTPDWVIARRFDMMLIKMSREGWQASHRIFQIGDQTITMEVRWYYEQPGIVVCHVTGQTYSDDLAYMLWHNFLLFGHIIDHIVPDTNGFTIAVAL